MGRACEAKKAPQGHPEPLEITVFQPEPGLHTGGFQTGEPRPWKSFPETTVRYSNHLMLMTLGLMAQRAQLPSDLIPKGNNCSLQEAWLRLLAQSRRVGGRHGVTDCRLLWWGAGLPWA